MKSSDDRQFGYSQNGRRGWVARNNRNNSNTSSINFGSTNQENVNAKRLPKIGDRDSASASTSLGASIKPLERFSNHVERGRANPLSHDTTHQVKRQGRAHDQVKPLKTLPQKHAAPPASLIWAPEIDAVKGAGASGLKSKSWAREQQGGGSSSIYPAGFTTPISSDIAAMLSLHGQMVKMVFNSSNIGPRIKRFPEAKTNQDRGTIVFPFAGNSQQALFLIADGHGDKGDWASDLSGRLLVAALESDPRMADMNQLPESTIRAAFTDAFETTNSKVLNSKELRGAHASGGTTMTVVVVAAETLYSAWAGDSRTVMGTSSKTVPLSRDHTCAIPEEWQRVDRAGGKRMVNEQTGAVRVVVPGARADEFHTLAMSRSMGDKPFHAAGVVATPEVWKFEMNCSGPRPLLIVASDGIWEQVENAEAIEVSLRGNQSQDAAKAVKSLMDYTTEKWALNNPCYRDDITAICINMDALVRNVFGGNSGGRHRQA